MTKRTKVIIASVLSVGLIAGLAAVIATVGVVLMPKFESLRSKPDPSITGTIAYSTYEDNGSQCLWTVRASGEGDPHKVTCRDGSGFGSWAFDRDGRLLVTDPEYLATGITNKVRVYDITTNLEVESFDHTFDGADATTFPDTGLGLHVDAGFSDYDGGFFGSGSDRPHRVWVATDEDGNNRLVDIRVPGAYSFTSASRSPDGKWILISGSEGDLLIADLQGRIREFWNSGTGPVYSFAGSHGIAAWYQPGVDKGTVDVDALRKNTTPKSTITRTTVLSGKG